MTMRYNKKLYFIAKQKDLFPFTCCDIDATVASGQAAHVHMMLIKVELISISAHHIAST
jgi:hypothetical protein